ncbi:MAG: archease [Campylobacterales bacterium]|jgi:SHS2 domain-containing protein
MGAYDYFDHDADIGIIGRGESIETAFTSAAEAMFAIMGTNACSDPSERVDIAFAEPDPELALVQWLNLLLAEAASRRLLLYRFRLTHHGREWKGSAQGCPLNMLDARGTEVKGATLTMLSVSQNAGTWEARCVVDV